MELQTPLPLTPTQFPEPPREKLSSSAEFVPDSRSLSILCIAAASCAGCKLFRCATQTVFGEAPRTHY